MTAVGFNIYFESFSFINIFNPLKTIGIYGRTHTAKNPAVAGRSL
jgi:hypothetical protein